MTNLIERLASPNVYYRDIAQRLLTERNTPSIAERLFALAQDKQAPAKQRRHALFALAGCDLVTFKNEWDYPEKLFASDEAWIRAWALRIAGIHAMPAVRAPSGIETYESTHGITGHRRVQRTNLPDVRLQALILFGNLARANRTYVSFDESVAESLLKSPDDPLMMRTAPAESLRPHHKFYPSVAPMLLRQAGAIGDSGGGANWLPGSSILSRRLLEGMATRRCT